MNLEIDYKKLAKWLVPIPLLGKRILAFINATVFELKVIYNAMLKQRDNFKYYLSITPQVCYLQKMLNDRYDYFDRRITIDDGQSFDALYVYQKLENKPVFLFQKSENQTPVYLYKKNETGNDADDFVVNVPVAVLFDEPEMKALINTFKLAGTVYSIEIKN